MYSHGGRVGRFMGSPWVKGVCVLSVVLNFGFILFREGKVQVEDSSCPVTFHGGGGGASVEPGGVLVRG